MSQFEDLDQGVSHHIPNHLVEAILCTLFCCMPLGIVAIVFAAQVDGKLHSGDVRGARQASAAAGTWCAWSFGLGLLGPLLGFLLMMLSAALQR